MWQAVDDHVGDDSDQHQRGDVCRGTEHAKHDLVGQVLVDAALLAVGKGTLDALARRGRIDVVSTESDIAYPLFFLEIRRTMPTSVAEMINRTTPMPNSAERCRPEE